MNKIQISLLLFLGLPFSACSSNSTPRDPGFQNQPGTTLLLYSSLNSEEDIFRPTVATATYENLEDAIVGPDSLSFEAGEFENAVKFSGTSDNPFVDGIARIHGDNIDLSDLNDNGGRLDFWIKFNQDPHQSFENLWFARANFSALDTGFRLFDIEYVSSQLHIYMYSKTQNNERTNYGNFKVTPRTMAIFEDQELKQGDWFQITLLWRRNGGPHKAQFHVFINGSQEGCRECNDYNGNLPLEGEVTDLYLSPALPQSGGGYRHMQFSMDEIYSFDGWDTTGVEGSFADLEMPQGVSLTYPMDKDYPWYGSPVPTGDITFEFFAVHDSKEEFDCDLYVDEAFVDRVTTQNLAHTEISKPGTLANGEHTYQVKCDEDQLISEVFTFSVEST